MTEAHLIIMCVKYHKIGYVRACSSFPGLDERFSRPWPALFSWGVGLRDGKGMRGLCHLASRLHVVHPGRKRMEEAAALPPQRRVLGVVQRTA